MSVKQRAQYSETTEVKRSQQRFYKLLSLSYCNMVILVGTVSLAV